MVEVTARGVHHWEWAGERGVMSERLPGPHGAPLPAPGSLALGWAHLAHLLTLPFHPNVVYPTP